MAWTPRTNIRGARGPNASVTADPPVGPTVGMVWLDTDDAAGQAVESGPGVGAHEADPDPHAQYLLTSEGDARYPLIGHTHPAVVASNPQSGTAYTLVLSDAGKAVETTAATAVTVTVPPASAVAFPAGTVIELAQLGAGQLTVAAGVGVTLRTASTLVARSRYSTLSLRLSSTDVWIVAGDLA